MDEPDTKLNDGNAEGDHGEPCKACGATKNRLVSNAGDDIEPIVLNEEDEYHGANPALFGDAQNERERALLRHMHAIHEMVTSLLMDISTSHSIELQLRRIETAAKLMKVDIQIFDAIERSRRKGHQRVTVEHIPPKRPRSLSTVARGRAEPKPLRAKSA
jgi:hypothetical protein